MISFDIETEPVDDKLLIRFCPDFDPDDPKYEITEFDPDSVKFGNTKDPVKRAAKLGEAEDKHYSDMEHRRIQKKKDEENHFENWKAESMAALDPAMGQVCAIGFASVERFSAIARGVDGITESEVLGLFWRKCESCIREARPMVGHNIFDFDLRFLILRSNILGVDVPPGVVENRFEKWPRYNRVFIDTRKLWLMTASPGGSKSSFAHLAAAFGTSGKHDGLSGADFAELLKTDTATALKYLEEDCRQPLIWAQKMGVKP